MILKQSLLKQTISLRSNMFHYNSTQHYSSREAMELTQFLRRKPDPDLVEALKRQEMRVEHTINLIRLIGILFLYLLNISALISIGSLTVLIGGFFLLAFVAFLAYTLFVHYFSGKGKYSPWLKYLTVTLDFTVLTGSFQKFRSSELMEHLVEVMGFEKPQIDFLSEMSSDIIASYLLIFILYNFLSALRNGYFIILYSTCLSFIGSIVIMIQSDMAGFAQFYALFLVLLSGVLTLTVSLSVNGLFMRFQTAAQKVKEYSQTLEVKVDQRTVELNQKNQQLNAALTEVELSNKKIVDSIQYAKRIQNSLLPGRDYLDSILPHNLLIWIPRDIVGGDIYYTDIFEKGSIVAVLDCTGHGIPGAFMTMLALSGIKRITSDEGCLDPAEILKRLNSNINNLLHQDSEQALSDDGLDASVCFIDHQAQTLTFAGARQSLIYIHNDQIQQIKGDRHSIGYKKSDLNFKFTNKTLAVKKGMSFYLFTDGLVDQLGGDRKFGFGNKRLHNLLLENHRASFDEQRKKVLETFNAYRGDNETRDDITVLGFNLDPLRGE